MNTKNLLIASLVGAITTTALANIPYISIVNCLLCVGFWGGAILSVWLYQRMTGTMTIGQAVIVGTVTGVFSGLLGFLLGLVGLAGAAGLIKTYGPLLAADESPDLSSALTGSWIIIFNLVGVMVNIVFGALGGLIGGAIFKSKTLPQ
jgi:hypothetical protein